MEQITSLVLLLLFVPRSARELLLHAYWWQVKEYRLDRFLVFLKTKEGRRVVAPPLSWIKLFLLLSSPLVLFTRGYLLLFLFLVGLLFLVEDLIFARALLERRVRKPVFTLRAKRIIGTGVVFSFVLLGVGYQLGFWPNTFAWAVLLLLTDKLIPFSIPAGIGWTQLLVNRTKRREVREAREKLEKAKDLVSVGITGSYGKTSTKEFLSEILSSKFRVAKTTGSENTEFGIARKIEKFVNQNTQVFVAEVGSYKKGEIKRLTDIVRPKIGIITGIAPQHLELYGSLKNLKEAKYELIEALPENGVAIFNAASPGALKLARKTKRVKTLIYQVGKPKVAKGVVWADGIRVGKDKVSFLVHWGKTSTRFNLKLLGAQFVENVLGATACALALGMTLAQVAKAAEKIRPVSRTMEPKRLGTGALVIDDTYSSNPQGFEAALDWLQKADFKSVVVITPGIIELGKESQKIHKRLGVKLARVADQVFLTSADFYQPLLSGMGKTSDRLKLEKDPRAILEGLSGQGKGDVILLEGRVPEAVREKLIQA